MDAVDEWGLPQWPAAERNKQPILDALRVILEGRRGTFLEIASATGQHIAHFSAALTGFEFVPSDCDDEHLATLERRVTVLGRKNLGRPRRIDTTDPDWGIGRVEVIYCANMVHIAPLSAAQGLFAGAARHLTEGGLLVTYGPYAFSGRHTSESNERFDASLRERDPAWGVRDVDELGDLALAVGLGLSLTQQMPANNFILVWERRSVAAASTREDDASHE